MACVAASLTLLAGCGSLPPNVGSVDSVAVAPSQTSPLVEIAANSTPPGADLTGVRLLPLGSFSLEARIQLAQRATTSLDVQYYVLENDATGRLLMTSLRDAALRGVRVRLLVDDLYTQHSDPLLRGLASFPNVTVHLFNPFCCSRESGVVGRYVGSVFDFSRLNHRMHNKLFIADGVMAVAGGRNIADEYFLRASEANFVDMDAFVMGQAVRQFAAIFDRYWNSEVVYPITAIGEPLGDKAARRRAFDEAMAVMPAAPLAPPSNDVLGYAPIGEELKFGRIGLIWGEATAFADPPDKLLAKTSKMAYETSVTHNLMLLIWRAQRELVVTSPYLIPGERGMTLFRSLLNRNVDVTLVTNSLAATDEPLVHVGYARYRPPLLEAGADLYELSPTRTQRTKRLGTFGASLGRLHAKTAVIDRKLVFIGSMNLDPRSESINTEFGMIVDSPALAKELLRVVNISKLESAYRLRLDPKTSTLQWLTFDDDKEVALDVEPESSGWFRFRNSLLGWFVPEELL